MRGTWDRPPVGRPGRRASNIVGELLGRFGSVVSLILWVNVGMFILQVLGEALRWSVHPRDAADGLTLFEYLLALNGPRLLHGFLWQPITYMFLHGGLWHILINLLILWFIGREVEYFIGPKYFSRLYVLGGVIGAALWLAFNFRDPLAYVLGASAGVLAAVIAFATLFPDRDITLLVFFVFPVTIKAKYLAWILVAFDVVPLLQGRQTEVAHLAHLGGAAVGYLYIKHLGYGTPPRWMLWLGSVRELLRIQRRRRPSSVRPAPSEPLPDDFIEREVDPILDKIAREGMQSLTRRERQILDRARERMQKKSP